ncbi:hypothetical protein M3J09_006145 [Ascochyta lentis]
MKRSWDPSKPALWMLLTILNAMVLFISFTLFGTYLYNHHFNRDTDYHCTRTLGRVRLNYRHRPKTVTLWQVGSKQYRFRALVNQVSVTGIVFVASSYHLSARCHWTSSC